MAAGEAVRDIDPQEEGEKKKNCLSREDYLQQPRSLYLSDLDEIACREIVFVRGGLLFLYYLPFARPLIMKRLFLIEINIQVGGGF